MMLTTGLINLVFKNRGDTPSSKQVCCDSMLIALLLLSSVSLAAYAPQFTHIFDTEWSDKDEINQFPYRWEDVFEFERGYGHRLLPLLNFKHPSTIISLLYNLQQRSIRLGWNQWGCSGLNPVQLKDLLRGIPPWRYELVFGRECRQRLPMVFWTLLDPNAISHLPSLSLSEIPEGVKLPRPVREMLEMRGEDLLSFTE